MSIINKFAVDCDAIACPDGNLGAAAAQTENCNDVVLSEVNSIILVHPTLGTPILNWGTGLVVGDFDIDNTDATNVKQKRFFVSGEMAEPDDKFVKTNSFNQVKMNGLYTLTADLYTLPIATYDYFRKIACGKVRPQLYFTTMGGKIFGKDGGITCSKISANIVLGTGEDSIEMIKLVFEWYALNSPDRYENPLP